MEYDLSRDENLYYLIPPQLYRDDAESAIHAGCYVTAVGYFQSLADHYILRPEGMDDFLLILCLSGRGSIRVGEGERLSLTPGRAMLLPPCVPHEYQSSRSDPWTILWMHANGSLLREMRRIGAMRGAMEVLPAGCVLIRQLFFEGFDAIGHMLTPRGYFYLNQIACHILGALTNYTARPCASSNGEKVVGEAIRYMQKNIDRQVTLRELATETHYSPSYLSQLFQRVTRASPIDYFISMKLQLAGRELYFSDAYVKDIAAKFGFDDALYFSRLFRRHFGMSPNQYRTARRVKE